MWGRGAGDTDWSGGVKGGVEERKRERVKMNVRPPAHVRAHTGP